MAQSTKQQHLIKHLQMERHEHEQHQGPYHTPQEVCLMLTFVGTVRLVSSFTTLRGGVHCTGCVPQKKINMFYPWNKDETNHVQ